MEHQHQQLTKPEQQRFLGDLSRAETRLKCLVVLAVLTLKPKMVIYAAISRLISELVLSETVIEGDKYLLGLKSSAIEMVRELYPKVEKAHKIMSEALLKAGAITEKQAETPLSLFDTLSKKSQKDMVIAESKVKDIWAKRKGVPNVSDYAKQVKRYIGEASKTDFAPAHDGKKPITMWQKAELDLRYQSQLEMLEEKKATGDKLWWISSHPDCSERCAKWQGKLVNITDHAELSGFRMKDKEGGHTVYSLTDIMAQKDKYGYNNNVIIGFNCRHRLLPYRKGETPTEEYSKEEMQRERKVNATLRAMERAIRKIKQEADVTRIYDPARAKRLHEWAKTLTEKYKKYANDNGYPWFPYRIEA